MMNADESNGSGKSYIESFIFQRDICEESDSRLYDYRNKNLFDSWQSTKSEYRSPDAEEDDSGVLFPDYMNQMMQYHRTDRIELAELLDFSEQSLKKRLNCSKGFDAKRDLIIALCLLLQANEAGIRKAIQKYNEYKWYGKLQKWYPLFSRDNRNDRDAFIIENLSEVYRMYPPVSRGIVDEINRRLISKSYGGFILVNPYKKNVDGFVGIPVKKADDRFIITRRGQYNLLIDDPFGYIDSLESQYALSRADSSCMFAVRDTVTGRKYRLRYFVRYYGGESMFLDSLDDGSVKGYKSIDETFGFRELFHDLRNYTLDHQRKLLKILDDTRNYEGGTRISANLRENAIHVFMESYNFQFPEEHEYYLFEYSRGNYSLSVYHRSCFLANYLLSGDYDSFIGKQKPVAAEVYHSPEEIEIKDADETSWYHSVAWHRRKAFDDMKTKTDALLEDIKTERKKIRDYNGPLGGDPEGPATVCRFLGLEKDFDCQSYSDDYGDVYMHGKEVAEIVTDSGVQTELTIQEVIRAFELGYHNRSEIIENKMKYGKIDEVF